MIATMWAQKSNMDGRTSPEPALPTLLSFNGGFVDTAGYLALQGLFTAHA